MSKTKLSVLFATQLTTAKDEGLKALAEKILAELRAAEEREDTLIADLQKKSRELESATALIEEQAQLVQAANASNPNYRPVAKVGKKSYLVNHGIRTESGRILTPDEVAADPKLIAELLKSQSTAVTELTEEQTTNA